VIRNVFCQTFRIVGGDFGKAGDVSTKIKDILKEIGIAPSVIRRAAIASYEAEMNVVMYTREAVVTLILSPDAIELKVEDQGPGIPDIRLAMQEGYSTATNEMREMGFGAGLGLPNIKKNADTLEISSAVGRGTSLHIIFNLDQKKKQ
jgi:anti-sigma regulatory factor (Ser/Thr protein kinase)